MLINRSARRLTVAVALTGAAILGVAPQASAATSATVGGCEVTAYRPYIETVSGVRYAKASVYVSCTQSRSGIANFKLMEADPGFDDQLSSRSASFSLFAGQTTRVGVLSARCTGFDVAGNEELYSEAKINVGGINSGNAQSIQLSTQC